MRQLLLLCAAALALSGCNDFDEALAHCRETHQCEDSTRAPLLAGHAPEDGAVGLPVQTRLSLQFDEPMDRARLRVHLTPAYEVGEPSWSESDTRVSFPAPPAELQPGREYVVTVEGADLGGAPLAGTPSFRFTTVDTTSPTVVSTQPGDGAVEVALNAALSVSFSERMRPDTAGALLTVSPSVGCTYEWASSDTLLLCRPTAPLEGSTEYTVTVTQEVKDVAGNAGVPHTFRFTTAAAPDTTPPTVVSTDPAPGASGVDTLQPLTLVFSEPMDRASVEAAFVLVAPAGATGTFQWDTESTRVTFTPAERWPYGTRVHFRLEAGTARDLADNGLATAYQGSFEVETLVGPVVLESVKTLDGFIQKDVVNATQSVATGNTLLYVGDDQSDDSYRSFVSFDLSSIPAGVTYIAEAQLVVTVTGSEGDPTPLGPLTADSVLYGTLDTGDWDTPTLQRTCSGPCEPALKFLFDAPVGSQRAADVTDAVRLDHTLRASRSARSQFRLFVNGLTDGDGRSDRLLLGSGDNSTPGNRPRLLVRYEQP